MAFIVISKCPKTEIINLETAPHILQSIHLTMDFLVKEITWG